MKIFISSLITGMEPIRAAARAAVEQLGHQPVMAEDFIAGPRSPQVACLQGLRESALVILILGAHYGAKQPSGLSATHEEYREAKERCPVIAFVQEGVDRDDDEKAFVSEVQAWDSGLFRGGFTTSDQVGKLIGRAVHEWELANAGGPVDPAEMLTRATGMLPESDRYRGYYQDGMKLVVAIAAGPRQTILRPSEIERPDFADKIAQMALFGPTKMFELSKATSKSVKGDALIVAQDKGAELQIDPTGSLRFILPLPREGHGPIVIEEEVQSQLAAALSFTAGLLDQIDPTQKLTHVVVAATLDAHDSVVWRTRAENEKNPNSYSLGIQQPDRKSVSLNPPQHPRAALQHQTSRLVEDLTTLLRRSFKSG